MQACHVQNITLDYTFFKYFYNILAKIEKPLFYFKFIKYHLF